MSKTYKIDEDLIIDKNYNYLTDEGLESSRGVKPTKKVDFKESEDNMISVFRESSDDDFGMEYVYDAEDNKTSINILAKEDDDVIYEDIADHNPINYTGVKDPLDNIKENHYIGSGSVELTNDYWHEMKLYDEYEGEQLRRLMRNITEKGESNVNVSLQFTFTPLDRDEWDVRYPLIYIILKTIILTPIILHIYILAIISSISIILSVYIFKILDRLTFGMITKYFSVLSRSFSVDNTVDKTIDKITSYSILNPISLIKEVLFIISDTFNIATGYSRKDFIDEYKTEIKKVEGEIDKRSILYKINKSIDKLIFGYSDPKDDITSKKYGNDEYIESLNNIISEIKRKTGIKDDEDNTGYATTFRFVVYGENQSEVNNKIDDIKNDIESTFNPSSDKNQNGLKVNIDNNKIDIKNTIINISEKKTAKDSNNNIINNYMVKSLHIRRNKPTILTPKEIVSFMHMPSDMMDDKTMVSGEDGVGGGVDEEGIFDYDDIE